MRQRRMMSYQQAMAFAVEHLRQPFGARQQVERLRPASARGSQPGLVRATAVEKRPWLDKPASGIDFDVQNTAAVVLPAIGAEVTVVSFTVPAGKNGVIKRIANQFVGGGWTEGTGDLVWRIEADGVAARNFENIIASLGSMFSPRDFGQGGIKIYENQTIALILRNVAVIVAAQPIVGLLGGWFYPIEQEGESSWF